MTNQEFLETRQEWSPFQERRLLDARLATLVRLVAYPTRISIHKFEMTKLVSHPGPIQSHSVHGQSVDDQSAGYAFGGLVCNTLQNVRNVQ